MLLTRDKVSEDLNKDNSNSVACRTSAVAPLVNNNSTLANLVSAV